MASKISLGNSHTRIKALVYSALFLTLAIVLPFLTGGIPQIGNMLCPMHIPVMLCGFICGAPWGAAIGLAAPILRSVMFGAPIMMPAAVSMAFELCTYGLTVGLLYRLFPKKKPFIYLSLLTSMLAGRLIWGAVRFVISGFQGTEFSFSMFYAGAIGTAIPGIILQIVLIPAIIIVVERFNRSQDKQK